MQITKSKKQMPKCPCEITKWRFQITKKQKKYRAVAKNQKSKRNENSDADYKEAEF